MWIRDDAPKRLVGVRLILYGYDSGLAKSKSTQLIGDIARGLIEHLKLGGWNTQSAKPMAFLAHSLGGLVLKDALVQIADANDSSTSCLVKKISGAVMFGVPNLGMEQAQLQSVVEGQANEVLIEDLSRTSNYLHNLDTSFSGITFLQESPIFWAYETVKTKTVGVSS